MQDRSTKNAFDRVSPRECGSVQHLVPRFQLRPALRNHIRHRQSTGQSPLQYLSMPAMDESTRWRSERYLTLLLVITVHAGLLAWLVSSLRAPRAAVEGSAGSVQVGVHTAANPAQDPPRKPLNPLRLRMGTPAAPPPPLLDAAFLARAGARRPAPARRTAAPGWTGPRRNGGPCRRSRSGATSRRAVTWCRGALPPNSRGGPRTVPVTATKPPTATGSFGSIRAATRWLRVFAGRERVGTPATLTICPKAAPDAEPAGSAH